MSSVRRTSFVGGKERGCGVAAKKKATKKKIAKKRVTKKKVAKKKVTKKKTKADASDEDKK